MSCNLGELNDYILEVQTESFPTYYLHCVLRFDLQKSALFDAISIPAKYFCAILFL